MHGDITHAWATASPAELKALSDPIGNGVLVLEVGAAGRFCILSLNQAIENITGLQHAALSGVWIEDFLPASELAVTAGRYQRCVDTRERIDFVSELDLPERKFWWQTTLTPIFNAEGDVVRLLASTVDFTARHDLEEELRLAADKLQQSQNRLQWAIVGGEIGIWEWDIVGRQVWMSDPWPAHRKTGASPGTVPIDDWVALIHPAQRDHALAVGLRAMADEIPAYSIEYQVRLASGEWQWRLVYGTITERSEAGKPTRICGTYQDITQQKQDQQELRSLTAELEYRATYDSLTKVMNRGAIIETLDRELLRASRDRTGLTVALLDVDHFKSVNDRYGHPVGDEVLVALVERIRTVLRPYDHLGRYGGEEFLIVAPARNGIENLHERIRAVIARLPFLTQAGPLDISGSIGVAIHSAGQRSADALLAAADRALYQAKLAGRNQVARADRQPDQ